MTKTWLQGFPFPLAIAAFAGIGGRYFDVTFTISTRWIFLALLTAMLVVMGRTFVGLKNGFGLVLLIYYAWCVSTAIWFEVSNLSVLKSAAVVLTSLTFVSGGCYWGRSSRSENSFSYLIPLTFLAIFAGIGGGGRSSPEMTGSGIELYEGLAGNPNFLGMLIALSFPYALY